MTETLGVGSSSVLQDLSDDGFRILLASSIAISCILLGLGLERSVGRYLLFHATDATAIVYFNFIIMVWPIFLLVCLSFSMFGLLFGATGLFFGGIPFMSYDLALAADTRRSFLARILSGGKACANMLHHGSFLFACSLIIVGQVAPDRSIFSAGIPLLVMHFAALVEPISTPVYYSLVLMCEFWFQCELFAYLAIVPTEMKVAFLMMLTSHWVFLVCTAALMVVKKVRRLESGDNQTNP